MTRLSKKAMGYAILSVFAGGFLAAVTIEFGLMGLAVLAAIAAASFVFGVATAWAFG